MATEPERSGPVTWTRSNLDLLATVLLAVAAVATAWSSYQSARWSGVQTIDFSRANAARIESARASGEAGRQTQVDVLTFTQWANAYARGAAMIAFGGAVAVVGFALLNVAIAFAVSTLFAQANFSQPASYALGFLATGGFYLIVGAIVMLVVKNRLAKQNLVPKRTVQELRKDKEWLKNEL